MNAFTSFEEIIINTKGKGKTMFKLIALIFIPLTVSSCGEAKYPKDAQAKAEFEKKLTKKDSDCANLVDFKIKDKRGIESPFGEIYEFNYSATLSFDKECRLRTDSAGGCFNNFIGVFHEKPKEPGKFVMNYGKLVAAGSKEVIEGRITLQKTTNGWECR